MHREAVPGNPHSGGFALNRVRGVRPVDAHGLFWNTLSAPPGYGLTVDIVGNHYDRPIIEFREFEQLLDGTLNSSAIFASRESQGFYLFVGEVPFVIDVQIPPGVSTDLFWLVFF
jgi:hypothetical protein